MVKRKAPPRVVGVIPTRWGSTRFPGKALADIAGKPMLQRVYERTTRARSLDDVWVATDDERIYAAAAAWGARVMMTAAEHPSGTDRVAEVAAQVAGDIFVNVQGDEPLLRPEAIDAAVEPLRAGGAVVMTTLARPVPAAQAPDIASPHICKVVVDRNGDALYFTRALVPYRRIPQVELPYLRHIGLYAFRREFLLRFTTLAPTALEAAESLEMLRALAHGFKIRVVVGDFESQGVDTPEDLPAVTARLAAAGEDN